MSLSGSDLGELSSLATALGLAEGNGTFRDDWLSRPGYYLGRTLADETQRDALIAFIDDVLGGAERDEDTEGRVWLPLFSETNPRITVYLVLDDRPTDHVRIGIGVSMETTAPSSSTRLFVMPFRAAKDGHSVPNPILLGEPGGDIGLTTHITLDDSAPAPGAAHLGGFGLGVLAPTDGSAPTVSVQLTDLQMPGTTAPRDLSVSVSNIDELDDAALDLVLGIVRAQVDAHSGDPALARLAGLAGMLGLREGIAVPPLPVAELAERGAQAIADWFDDVIGSATSRSAWLRQVAELLGAGASVSGDEVRFTVGPANIGFGVRVAAGASGQPVITPFLSASVEDGSARGRAELDLLRLDLGTGDALAVPRVAVFGLFGRANGTGSPILTGDPGIDAVRVGVALDEQRRPVFLLAADNVTIAGNTYETLDLSTPDAVAEVAGTVLSDVADDLLGKLGPAGDVLSTILGLSTPPSHPTVPTLDLGAFLQNPLVAVRSHWRSVLRDHAAAVPELLESLRDLLADDAVASLPVDGSGTRPDPWRIRLVGPVALLFWMEDGGDRLEVALAASYTDDALGPRVETLLHVGIASIDLANGGVVFAPGVEVRVAMRASDAASLELELGPLELSADHVALSIDWAPDTGVRANVMAPNLVLRVDELDIPVDLTELALDGSVTPDAAGWAALETLAGALGTVVPVPWVRDLLNTLGWSFRAGAAERPRLRLADLQADAEAELRRWLGELLLDERATIVDLLTTIARVLTGDPESFGFLDGGGRPDRPWSLPLLPLDDAPQLAAWLGPAGPRHVLETGVPDPVRDWRPGSPPLAPSLLDAALHDAARTLADIDALVAGRVDIDVGLEALITRWTGTDGRVVPPATDPAGIHVLRVADATARMLADRLDLAALFGGEPATTIHVAVVAPDTPLPWPDAAPERVIDLRAPGLAPEAFTPPAAESGEWFIALASRTAARLSSGDADGTTGQARRLARVLGAFSGTGDVVLVAAAEAGHAAILAANELAHVTGVVTLGTPLGPVAFSVLDEAPAADALRLLRALLPASDEEESDDPDLARARDLVDGLMALLPLADPASELHPPAAGVPAPRSGLAVHALFGVLSEDAVRRAITAVVTTSLSTRAMRLFESEFPGVDVTRSGIRVPIRAGTGGITITGDVVLELFGTTRGTDGLPALSTDRAVRVRVEVRRPGGWLFGGPEPGRSGTRPDHELRWIETTVTIPLGGSADGAAEIVLHEPRVFGVSRERWIVRADASGVEADDVVTPTLPEVRVLLSHAIATLEETAADNAQVTALLELLRGVGIVGAEGGSVPDAIDHLLHDVRTHVHDALNDASRLPHLQNAADTLLAAVPGLSVDLASRALTLALTGSAGTHGLLDWSLNLSLDGNGAASADITVGTPGDSPAGGAVLRVTSAPFEVLLEWHRAADAPDIIRLWPSPDSDAVLQAVVRLLPAEMLRQVFQQLRGLNDTVHDVLDNVLDAIGLLGDAATDGARRIRLPVALLEDPAAFLRHPAALGGATGFSPARVASLLDAVKPLLGINGPAGEWELAPGVRVSAEAHGADLRLAAAIDTAGFSPPDVSARLVATIGAGLLIRSSGAPLPSLSLIAGLPGAAPGRRALHVALNGDLRVFLRPESGADIPLYPEAPGLGRLADIAVQQALPLILDELAAQTGPGLAGEIGAIVREAGDVLGLRSGTPARFQPAALKAWADDPAGRLADSLTGLAGAALNQLAAALANALPASISASVAGDEIQVVIGGVTVALATSPLAFRITGEVSGIPGVDRIALDMQLDEAGLQSLITRLGPAQIDAGGVILRPFIGAAAGNAPAGGRRIEFGLGIDTVGERVVGGRWTLDDGTFSLYTAVGVTVDTDPGQVALALLDAVLDLVASFAFSTPAMQQFLDVAIPGTTGPDNRIRNLLAGVLLDSADPTRLADDLFDPAELLDRLMRLIGNFATLGPSIPIGGGITIGVSRDGGVIGLHLGVTGRVDIVSGDVYVALETDSRWIDGTPAAGLQIGVLRESAGSYTFEPSISINGVGLRVGRSNGPLLDVGLTLGSVALHGFGRVSSTEKSGGVQVQLSELAVTLGGASGGNPVAQGLLSDASSGSDQPSPAFSPALAIQKHGGNPVKVSLRAGDGDGPWWLAIQKGFGPLYIEQVGLGVTTENDNLESIALLLDGRVSLFGLTAAVDDLQLRFNVASDASPFDPSRWYVDLAGLAISADMGGVVLAGGLRKFTQASSIEYVGMLVARFATYGLSVYGGYGEAHDEEGKFAAFFAFGSIVGPIGGPPAFFVTGIGGGLGINRGLVFPTDLSRFGEFVFLKALDVAATPSDDPMQEMALMRQNFPMRRGEFWFAAGLSFNSFALVDGIAVVAVAMGDGLEITLLGLARMALPRPGVALVSIELGLIARFSTSEGVLWIQAQLTDNSWLLNESVRLTGGFAFVTWFKGPNAGQFVLTLGGYHPSFHREGYPVVPRLGFNWSVSNAIVIKGESYFALTSEAVMAGGRLEVSAEFGPAWAHLIMGADGIVYFDPFRFSVEVYASIAAGVTIDVWIGEITISISIGARVLLEGPKFRGRATFEVGPIELTVKFGDWTDGPRDPLPWGRFVDKYLEAAAPDVARVVAAIPGKGQVPPGTGPGGNTDTATADGSAERPFEVMSEFELTVTTLVPTRRLRIGGGAEQSHASSHTLGLAPMRRSSVKPLLELRLRDAGDTDRLSALRANVLRTKGFPIGVWGQPQDDDDRKVPKGEVIEAVDRVHFEAVAQLHDTLAPEIAYHQVEIGPRLPLPFVNEGDARAILLQDAGRVNALLPDAPDEATMYSLASPWLERGGYGRTAIAALQKDRTAPPRLGSLTEGLAQRVPGRVPTQPPKRKEQPQIDASVHPPEFVAVLTSPVKLEQPRLRTTVSQPGTAAVVRPPTLAQVRALQDLPVAADLILVGASAQTQKKTLIPGTAVPMTRSAHAGTAAVGGRGTPDVARRRLADLESALFHESTPVRSSKRAKTAAADTPALQPGEIAVLRMPNARHDVAEARTRPRLEITGGPSRVIVLGAGGDVLLDGPPVRNAVTLAEGAERIAVLALGDGDPVAGGLSGWHAGQELAYIGWMTAAAPGALVQVEGTRPLSRRQQRYRAGWTPAAELVRDATIVSTRFADPVTAIVVALDDPGTLDEGRYVSLDLVGATRPLDRNGDPVPPALVVSGNRSFLVYAVIPDEKAGAVEVGVARESGWKLAGVLGAQDTVSSVVDRLARLGLDAITRPYATGREGAVAIRWSGKIPKNARKALAARERLLVKR